MNRPSIESEDVDRDPFEELASDFAERYRNGELPSIDEYANSHPDLAEEIRELFPTIAAMEKSKAQSTPPLKPQIEKLPIQQLGDFRLLGEIGRGGMGIVYEAEQVSLGRHVAVKVLPQQALLDERHLRRFEREAQTAAKLHHTNIVPVFGVGQQDGYHYIVMQFIAGVGLDEVLLALRRQLFESEPTSQSLLANSASRVSHANYNAQALLKGEFSELPLNKLSSSFVQGQPPAASIAATAVQPTTNITSQTAEFSIDQESSTDDSAQVRLEDEAKHLSQLGSEFYQSVAKVGEQVADALAYAHEQGTLHRDIKPGNLLLDSTGTVWVADFGLAKFAEQDNVSRTGDIVGTLSYIPPESFAGETDARGDIYSLGLSLFELLTLRPAYFGKDRGKLVREITEGSLPRLKKLNPNIPRDLETIVLKAVAHRPEDRYATANELASDLNCFLSDMPIKARRMSVPEQLTRWYRKNKLVAALSAAVLTLLLALTVLFGISSHRSKIQVRIANDARKDAVTEKEAADSARNVAETEREAANSARKVAEKEREAADKARQNARDLLYESIEALKSVFAGFAPIRLPVSASSSMPQMATISPNGLGSTDTKDEENPTESTSTAGLLAPPPIKQETAARLEILLGSLETLAAKAEDDTEFAATFADLTLRVGTLHKTLGNNDRATESLDKAIARYKSLVSSSASIENIIGLAICYNEKADLLGGMNKTMESQLLFRQTQKLLERENKDNHLQSPRAQYELARTLFLMSIQRQDRTEVGSRSMPPRRFNLFGGAEKNLRHAIDLLEPLEKESNSEYRYLLARCYSALSSAARPEEQKLYVDKAIEVLESLVAAYPGVDDYTYEFAVAKIRRAKDNVNVEERLEESKQAVELLDQICGTNPDVFNYQIARSQALGRYVAGLDRNASQLSSSDNDDDFNMSLILRRDATDEADRAFQLFLDLREQFDDAFIERIPPQYQVELAEVVAKRDSVSAIEYFRDAISSSKGMLPQARAELGLARTLIVSNYGYQEASEILDHLNSTLTAKCEKELGRISPTNGFETAFALWIECTFAMRGSVEKAKPFIAIMREQRVQKLREVLPPEIAELLIPVLEAQLDLKTGIVYERLGSLDSQDLISQAKTTLEEIATTEVDKDPRLVRNTRRYAAYILNEMYESQGDVESAIALREKLKARSPGRPPRGGRPRSGGPPPR